jgi:phage repressor protein C with HTH and peptisase S24 domain
MENNRHGADKGRSAAAQALASIPVVPSAEAGDCSASEPFALRVLGDSMLPEFAEGEVVVVEPGGRVVDGSFVLAWWGGEWMLRQLFAESGRWFLVALNPACMRTAIPDLSPVRGVVIQKSVPGRRRLTKHYVD